MKLTINNVKQYFDLHRTPPSKLKPGMLYMFEYNAEKIHDQRPLIWVLEVKGDRVWGLNLHYDFGILADIIKFKEKNLEKEIKREKQKIQDEELKKREKEKKETGEEIPTIVDAETKNPKTFNISESLLDNFSDFSIGKNSNILRNYLNKKIRNPYKLSFKPPR